MFRKIVAITLFVSFIAMSTSGLMMFVISKPSFTLQMHPVHKLFGLLLIVAVLCHLSFNYRSLLTYLKDKVVTIVMGALCVALVVLYGVAITKNIPEELAKPMDELADKIEEHEYSNELTIEE